MPSTRWHRLVLLAVLAALAGCSMGPATQVEGARTPETPAPTEPPSVERPPGVTNGSVANASALLASHRASLRGTGYRLSVVSGGENLTYVATSNFSSYRIVPGENASQPAVWANETVTVTRMHRENRTVYRRPPRLWAGPAQLTGTRTLRTLFEASEFTVAGTEPCGARRCTVLTATGSARFENFSARAVVDPSGIVHEFHAEYVPAGHRTATTTESAVILTRLGNVTVGRPPWIESAIAST